MANKYCQGLSEHFLTIAFSRYGDGSGIHMTVKGWLVRDVDTDKQRKRTLPQKAFQFSRKLKGKPTPVPVSEGSSE